MRRCKLYYIQSSAALLVLFRFARLYVIHIYEFQSPEALVCFKIWFLLRSTFPGYVTLRTLVPILFTAARPNTTNTEHYLRNSQLLNLSRDYLLCRPKPRYRYHKSRLM